MPGDFLAVHDDDETRNFRDVEPLRPIREPVRVDLADAESALYQTVHRRHHRTAGTAGVVEKIEQNDPVFHRIFVGNERFTFGKQARGRVRFRGFLCIGSAADQNHDPQQGTEKDT